MAAALKQPETGLIVCKGSEALSHHALKIFFDLYHKAVSLNDSFRVVLSGGVTPGEIYSRLADPALQQELDWSRIHLFWGDERYVPPSHPESNYGMVKSRLISKIKIPEGNIHPIQTNDSDPQDAAKDYETKLRAFFKIEGETFPRFDFIFLGVGEDGHTASLFPETPELNEKKRWVVSCYTEKFKSRRITMTLPVFNQAAYLLILATGEKKAEVLKTIFNPVGPPRLPIQQIKPLHGVLTYLVDQAAASRL